MAINQSILEVAGSPVVINPVDVNEHPTIPGQLVYSWTSTSLIVQNIDSSAVIYLGDETLNSSNYGVSIPAGGSVTIDDLRPTELLYAISSGDSLISVLYIQR